MINNPHSGGSRFALVLGTTAAVAGSLPVFITAAMSVQVSAALGFGSVGIGGAVATFFATVSLSAVHLGRLADRLGSAIALRVANIGTAVAALWIAAFTVSWSTLAVGLVVAGLAAALGDPATNRLLALRIDGARLGAALGLKQSAPPLASMLAGLAVPLLALTVGWRSAYVLAGLLAMGVAAAVGRGAPAAAEPRVPGGRGRPAPLRGRGALLLLTASFALAFAASSIVLSFYVDTAVRAGTDQGLAGLVFAGASLTAIVTRVVAGVVCDRTPVRPLILGGVLLAVGSIGIGLFVVGQPWAQTVGVVLALGGSWGFPGVFWYALMRAYPETPGRITGMISPAAIGGVVGPLAFGALGTTTDIRTAWLATSAVALLASVTMLLGHRRLARA